MKAAANNPVPDGEQKLRFHNATFRDCTAVYGEKKIQRGSVLFKIKYQQASLWRTKKKTKKRKAVLFKLNTSTHPHGEKNKD